MVVGALGCGVVDGKASARDGPSHMVGAALTGLAAAALSGEDPAGGAALVVGSVAASRLPNVDAKLVPGPAHRNLPHSLLLAGSGVLVAALALFAWLSSGGANEALGGGYLPPRLSRELLGLGAIGLALGYLSHLALDGSPVSGIWLAVPGGTKLKPPKRYAVRTGGLQELVRTSTMLGACALLLGPTLGISVFELPSRALRSGA